MNRMSFGGDRACAEAEGTEKKEVVQTYLQPKRPKSNDPGPKFTSPAQTHTSRG